jgi:three-Cys-motif partner protein
LVDHEFGGLSTDLKLSIVEKYLRAYTTALRGKFANLWYIDAFAGTGYRAIKHPAVEGSVFGDDRPEWVEHRRGSAVIALETEPAFDRLIFIEKKPSHCAALQKLMAENPTRDITLDPNDANASIRKNVAWDGWASTRAVMFLDPYGLSVDWETLAAVAGTKAIDVWYLVSLSGLFRQAAHDPEALDDAKRASLTRMLGTPDWEGAWYPEVVTEDIFGNVVRSNRRSADVTAMEKFVADRLRTIFPKVLKPYRLHNERGVPMFALFFAISNPEPKAIGLATSIAGHILKAAEAGISS